MIPIKTEQEIAIMTEGGRRLALVFGEVAKEVRVGVRVKDLDSLAEKLIKQQGGKPSFQTVRDYRWATCININEGVVHGIPGEYKIKKGDLFSLDVGMIYEGFHTDMARTAVVGGGSQASNSFLAAGKSALKKAIGQVKTGNRIGHISSTIEGEVKKAGFKPVESLTGHGVGKNLHEEPQIFGYLKGDLAKTPLLGKGMVLAIEVIYVAGKADLVIDNDGWTISTADGNWAGLFEDTVALTRQGAVILTPLELKLNL